MPTKKESSKYTHRKTVNLASKKGQPFQNGKENPVLKGLSQKYKGKGLDFI